MASKVSTLLLVRAPVSSTVKLALGGALQLKALNTLGSRCTDYECNARNLAYLLVVYEARFSHSASNSLSFQKYWVQQGVNGKTAEARGRHQDGPA